MINPPQVLPEEPTAVTPHGGFCGGKSQQWLRYPTKPHAGICVGGAGQLAPLPAQFHCDEGTAIHIGPEPCTGTREDGGEASAGERIGQPLSRENKIVPGADVLINAEGKHGRGHYRERPSDPAWSKTLACVEALCTGTGRSRVRPAAGHRRSASGRRGVVAGDARAREV
jgi:hypothetical protein